MKLHFCDTIKRENLMEIESKRKERQQGWIAIFLKSCLKRDFQRNKYKSI